MAGSPENIAGSRLPGGTYRLTAADNERLCLALGVGSGRREAAHPLFYYIATQVGMGLSVQGLLGLCDFDVADGPLMTGSDASIEQELKVDHTYRVEGEIVSLVRKPSRTFGAVDLLRFRLRLLDEDGNLAVDCVNNWILPRRNAQA